MLAAFPDAHVVTVDEGWEDRWREFHHAVRIGPLWVGPPWEASPDRAPSPPEWPSPVRRMRWPSWMPSGISTWIVRSSSVRPDPVHVSQRRSIRRPLPSHSGHAI